MIVLYISTVSIKGKKQFPKYVSGFRNSLYFEELTILKKMLAKIKKDIDWETIGELDILLYAIEVPKLKELLEEYLEKELDLRKEPLKKYDITLQVNSSVKGYFNMRNEADKLVESFYRFWQLVVFTIEKERPLYITEIDLDDVANNYTYNTDLDS
jgi:hypothetical protein